MDCCVEQYTVRYINIMLLTLAYGLSRSCVLIALILASSFSRLSTRTTELVPEGIVVFLSDIKFEMTVCMCSTLDFTIVSFIVHTDSKVTSAALI